MRIKNILILFFICSNLFISYPARADSKAFNKVNQAVSDLINGEVLAFHKKGRYFSCRYSSCEKYLRDSSSGVKVSARSAGTIVYINAEARRGAAETVKVLLESAENEALTDSDVTIFRNLYEAKILLLLSEYRMAPGGDICEGSSSTDVCRFTVLTSSNNGEGVRRFSNEVRSFKGVKKITNKIVDTKRNSATFEFRVFYESPDSPKDESNIPSSILNHRLRKLLKEVVEKELINYQAKNIYRSCTAGEATSPGVERNCEALFNISLSKGESLLVHGGKMLSVRLTIRDQDSLISFEYRKP